jgi:hypothetical protein
MTRTRVLALSIAGAVLVLAGSGASASSDAPPQVVAEKGVDGAVTASECFALIGANPDLPTPQEIIDAPQTHGDAVFYAKVFSWLGDAAFHAYWVNAKVVNYESRVVGLDGAPGIRTLA